MTTRAVHFDRLITIPIERIAATGDVDGFGNPAPETVRSGMVWARREDFNARDALQATAGGLINIQDRRYTIRAENARAVEIGDPLVDENGVGLIIRGISQLDGRRYVELLAREIGA